MYTYTQIDNFSLNQQIRENRQKDKSHDVLANQTAEYVSNLLNSLLKDYDNSLRPNFGGNHQLCIIG